MAEVRTQLAVVGIKELKKGMNILSFLGFSDKYHHLDEATCKWVQHNFRGSQVTVLRGEQEVELMVDDMQPADNLQKLYKLPSHLTKITQVSDRLVQELEKRGFLRFRVEKKVRVVSPDQQKRQQNLNRCNKLSAKVKESVETHEEASEAVETLLDSARDGAFTTTEIQHYAESITSDSSAEAIAAMSSLKASDQTYAHCVEVAAIYTDIYFKCMAKLGQPTPFNGPQDSLLGGFLHDFGKSKVPKDVLDSTAKFERNSKEMRLLQSHPTFGAQLLSDLGMPKHIVNMAHYHHVKLDPGMKSSYPRVSPNEVMTETHYLALVDIYQALVGKRKYKKAWTPFETIKYLDALAGVEYPLELFNVFLKVMGKYPKSSLVQLNDGRAGFVMSVPEVDLERPQIAVLKNAEGEMLTHHDFVDLFVERDIQIKQVLDAQVVFGDDALDIFSTINIT